MRPRTGLLLLAALPFVLFWPVALGRQVFADGDLFHYNYPLLHTIARQWKAGTLPLWNPYLFGGTPLLATMQGGVFYPPNLLLLVLPEWLAFGYSILLHFSASGVFTFLYLRSLGLLPGAALLGGLTFMLGGFTMANLGHVSTLRTIPWLPLILLGLERWRAGRGTEALALAGGAAGCMLLAGHPQIPLYALMVSASYAAWLAATARGAGRWRLLRGLLAVLAIAAGLAAVQLLTTLAALPEYVRPGAGGYEYFAKHSLHPLMLLNLALPGLVPSNLAEQAVYVGLLPLVLAFVGARMPGAWDAHRRYFVVVVGLGLVLALGEHTPLHPWLHRLPVYRAFSAPARNWFEVTFALAVLAGFGAHALASEPVGAAARRACLRATVVVAVLCAVGGTLLWGAQRRALPHAEPEVTLGGFAIEGAPLAGRIPYLLGSFAILALVLRVPRAFAAGRALLLGGWLVADLFSFGGPLYALHDPSVLTEPPASWRWLGGRLGSDRILLLELPENIAESRETLARNYNAVLGAESVNGFDSLMLGEVARASGGVMPTYGLISGAAAYNQPQFLRFVDLLGARFVLFPSRISPSLDPVRFRPVFRNQRVAVYENAGALPRFQVLFEAWRVTQEQALQALASGRIGREDFLPHMALVEAPREGLGPPGFGAGARPPRGAPVAARITPSVSAGGEVRLEVETPADGVLVHATNHAQGWRAELDGAEVPILRVDGFLQGIALPAGRHDVRFRYRPTAFLAGAAISSLTLLGLAGLCAARPRRAG